MKAIALPNFDTAPAALDVPTPEPADGEVLVDVEYASVNGMDVAICAGYLKDVMPYELPITLGRDFAGTVVAVGATVTDFAPGDAVFGALASPTLHHGTLAEQLVIAATNVGKRPDGLGAETAGALALAGTAAQAAIAALALRRGETVLITGATGGVGSFALQLAKMAGATVIATATRDRAAFVRDLGADVVVDYTGDLAGAVKAARPEGVDAVLHAAGDPMALLDLVGPGGRIASVLGFGQQAVGERDVRVSPIRSVPSAQSLRELAALVVGRNLHVPVTKTYTLDEAPQALEQFTTGKVGKLVIKVR